LSVVSETLRAQVVARAGSCCEYCHLPTEGQVERFPIDHVLPRTRGGLTELLNLALACPHCNGHKWSHIDAVDPASGEPLPLFNPRTQVWSDHFAWSADDPAVVEGKTGTGRATMAHLHMNHPDLVHVRRLLARLGIPLGPRT
jgi:hypothetical protein